MDEPFGAIDPINRDRLQNEFLRLQGELRKTVVFVTHDIDEAIKIGDRIAVMQEGGVLAQYAPPAELLMYPANEFVADFVGADRALKRLSLQRVGECELLPADEAPDGPTIPAGALLRDALSELLANEAQAGRVVDRHGDIVGALSIEQISRAIAATPEAL